MKKNLSDQHQAEKHSFMSRKVQPNTINQESGSVRLITIDLIRGIAICLMTFAHILDELVLLSPEFFTEYLTIKEIVFLSPIIIIMLLFGSLK